MASSTYLTFLMYKEKDGSGPYQKLIDIKDYPDLGGTPNYLDGTSLSDEQKISIIGIQDLGGLEFTANYDWTEYKRLKAMENTEYDFAVWMGGTKSGTTVTPTGSEGKFKWQGKMSVYPSGGGVDEVRDLKIAISNTTPITADVSAS